MFNFLKNHPFPVEAFFDKSIVLTFAVPKEEIQKMIPPTLCLDTFEDKWAFIAVAMVQTSGLRPKGLPQFLGNDFFLIGYRIFVRYTNATGKKMRGLYILKSETNKRKMQFFGNIFTHYKYTTTDISQIKHEFSSEIKSEKSKFSLKFDDEKENISLPSHSPFKDWKEGRKFAGPLPFTFSYNPENQKMLVIEGVRQHWKPLPIEVLDYKFAFLEQLNLSNPVLANAFIIKNIPYFWKKGRFE